MKRIKLKYLCVVLVLFLVSGSISSLNRNEVHNYLAPFSFIPKEEITLNELVQQVPVLSHLIAAGEAEEKSYQEFVNLEEIKPNPHQMYTNDLNIKMIQMYLSLFLWSDQKWIPEKFDLNHFSIVRGKESFPEKSWATIFFMKSSSLKLKKVPDNLKEKSFEMAFFVLQLERFITAQGMKQKFFLDNLLTEFSETDQVFLLFLLSYGLRENEDHPLLKPFSYRIKENLSTQALQSIQSILSFKTDRLDLMTDQTAKDIVEKHLNGFCEIINAIPAGKISILEREIGKFLNEYITAGRNKLVQETSLKCYTKRYDHNNFFSKAPSLDNLSFAASL